MAHRLAVVATAGTLALLVDASSSSPFAAATLAFHATLVTSSPAAPCPLGFWPEAAQRLRGQG